MFKLDSMKLSAKLAGGFGVVLLVMTVVAVVVFTSISKIIDANKWVNHTYEVIRTAESVTGAMVDMETGQRGFMIAGEDEFLEPFHAGSSRVDELIAKGAELTSDNPVQGSRWEAISKLKTRWLAEAAEPEIDARRKVNQQLLSQSDVIVMMKNGPGKTIMDEIREIVALIVAEEERLIIIRGEQQEGSSNVAISSTMLGTGLAIFMGAIIAFMVTRGITVPLSHTNQILGDLADGKGDLDTRVPIETKDELSTLAKSFNSFMDKLQKTVNTMNSLAGDVISAATTSQASVQKTTKAIEHQVEEIDDLKSTIDDMCESVALVADNALNASSKANEANENAIEGQENVERLSRVIHDLAEDVKSSVDVVETLASQSKEIDNIVEMIRNIADQTNLLALNAAIEAARAGEQGRGFAVVADEVRNLSQQTASATEEIRQSIESLQVSTEQAVTVMGASREKALKSEENAENAKSSLSRISQTVAEITNMNTNIAQASDAQKESAQNVYQNISKIHEAAKQTADAAHNTTSETGDLSQFAVNLEMLASSFGHDSDTQQKDEIEHEVELF